MTGSLRQRLQQEMSNPGLIGLFVNPFYFARRGLYQAMQSLSPRINGQRMLDLGCGKKPYRHLFNVEDYVGVEVDTPETRELGYADIFYDGRTLPFEDAEFDAVLCNQVLEHVFEPEIFLSEIIRVLKPGGQLLLTVPFVWDEHEQPYDYARYSSFGLKDLLTRNGFDIVEQRKVVADVRVIFQLWNAYLYKLTATGNLYFDVIVRVVLMSPANIVGSILGWVLPDNEDLYLDNIVLASRTET